ncbi:MAG: cache domain-containing protein [Brevinematia bacterium]
MLKNIKLRTKITLVFILLNVVIFMLIVGVLSFIIYSNASNARQNILIEKTKSFSENLNMLLTMQARDYLERITEKELLKVNTLYETYEKGKLKKKDFVEKVRELLKNKTIGKSGYFYVLDRSKFPEKLIALIHPSYEGEDLFSDGTMRRIAERKSGLVEYAWKNKGEKEEKRKIGYFKYFEKMDWIIVASIYKEDLEYFVNTKEIKEIIEYQLKSEDTECFVLDFEGNLVLHPYLQGKNVIDLPYIQKMIKEGTGIIKYKEQMEGVDKGKEKLAYFVELPGYNWIVVGSTYMDIIKGELSRVNHTIIIIAIINLIIIWLVGRIAIKYIIKNLNNIKEKIYHIISGTEKADLTKRLEINTRDEIGEIANLVNLLFEKLNRDILKVKISSDLLTNSTDETSLIMEENVKNNINNIEKTIKGVKSLIDNAAGGIEELTATVEEMARNIDSIASSMMRQASAVEESASSIEEMVRNIENTATLSNKTKDISVNLNNVSLEGSKAVKESILSIKEVSDYSLQILKLLGLISNIAKQTNLLAMNAAIEAAHAGEAGKGFAIVADEIRRLSEDTNKNARDIGDVVSSIVSKIEESVKLAEKAGVGLDMITAYSKQNVDIISQLNIAMQEQSNGAKEILKATQELVKITEEVKIAMSEQKNATEDFSKALIELRDISVNMVEATGTHSESLSSLSMAIEKIRSSVELNKKQAEELKNVVANFILEEDKAQSTALRLVE